MSALERRLVERVISEAREAGLEIPPEVLGIAASLEHGSAAPLFDRWREMHPDVDVDELVPCCYGVAIYGWHRCECWEPVFDVEQCAPLPDPQVQVRLGGRCHDCAFRRDSPERSDQWSEEELLGLAAEGTPFWCHDGMRRPTHYTHPQLGTVPASDGDYQPLIVAGVPFMADGRAGLLCAGWAQESRRQQRATVEIPAASGVSSHTGHRD